MGWFEFIATMTGHLVWPMALVVTALCLRKPLSHLIKNVSRVRYAGAEISFEREAVEVELALRNSAEVQGVEPSVLQIEPPIDASAAERVGRVVDAWKRVERALKKRVEEKTGEPLKRHTDALRLAVQNDVLTQDQLQSLNGLRIMRNLAVHGPPTEFSEKHASQFEVLADALVTLLSFPAIRDGNSGA